MSKSILRVESAGAHEKFGPIPPIPDNNVTMLLPVGRPEDVSNDRQSMFAEQNDYILYHLPVPEVNTERGWVCWRKGVRLTIG